MNLSISNSKLENDTIVLILYNISSAAPPALSYVFLEPIIGFLKVSTKTITHMKMQGLIAIITNVKSQDFQKAIINPTKTCATACNNIPNFSPTPKAICSN